MPVAFDFPWPTPPGRHGRPRWTGHGFEVDGRTEAVLSFNPGDSHWSEDLTALHEAEAGEGTHFIDRASRREAINQLRRWTPHAGGTAPVILEAGCSSGYLLRDMHAAMPEAHLIGSDYIGGPLVKLAKTLPDVPLLQFDLTKCPLPDASVDAVVLLNVLEHIEDDLAAMKQFFRVLRPNGVAVIEVPAGPHLYDVYDKVLMHWRRYELKPLREKMRSVGFEVVRGSHLGFGLYPAFRHVKLRNRKHLKEPEEAQRRIVAQTVRSSRGGFGMNALMRLEQGVGRFLPYPWGIRCIITARRP